MIGNTLQKPKKSPARIASITIKVLILVLLSTVFLFPVEWMVVSSLKTHVQITEQMNSFLTFLPSTFNVAEWFGAYSALFTSFDYFARSIFNSFFYAAITIIGVLIVNSLAAYSLARFRFPGAKLITTIILLLIIVPIETSIVPIYVILHKLGLLNQSPVLRITGYLIPGFASAFYIFMFRSYFLGMPKELEEAAKIDGASRLYAFAVIILPLSKAIFATVTIFTFMGAWNEYVFARLLFTNPRYQPLQAFLQLINDKNPKDLSVIMASLTFSTAVIAVIYVFCQKYIVDGVSFSGLK